MLTQDARRIALDADCTPEQMATLDEDGYGLPDLFQSTIAIRRWLFVIAILLSLILWRVW